MSDLLHLAVILSSLVYVCAYWRVTYIDNGTDYVFPIARVIRG